MVIDGVGDAAAPRPGSPLWDAFLRLYMMVWDRSLGRNTCTAETSLVLPLWVELVGALSI